MGAGVSLLLAVVVSLGLSAVLVAVLAAPLRRVLATLCPTGEASLFWVAFTSVMLFMTPLLFSVMAADPEAATSAPRVLRATLLASLAGAGLALTAVGLKLASSMRQSGSAPGGISPARQ